MPNVTAAHAKYGDRVDFIGVNVTVNENKGRVQDSVKRRAVPAELNLVGQRVEEAVGHLESYLDAAMLAALPQVRR